MLPPGLQSVLTASQANLTTASLVQLAGAVLVAIVGGIWPALLAALWSSLLLNYFLAEPTGTLVIHDAATVVSIVIFLLVAGAVALVVDRSARRAARARQAGAEAAALSELALVAVASDDPIQSLLDQAKDVLRLAGAGLFTRPDPSAGWVLAASAGMPPTDPEAGDLVERVDPGTLLVLAGRRLSTGELRLVKAFSAQVTAVRARQQLATEMRENRRLAQDNRMRTSILRAVSHDLRTPIAGIMLAVDGLLQPGGRFSAEEQRELLRTVRLYADQLSHLVENLLDMSRISGDAVHTLTEPTGWRAVVDRALRSVPASSVEVRIPPEVGAIRADPGLLERVIANLAENAARHAPGSPIVLTAGEATDGDGLRGELRVADSGGAPLPPDLDDLFRPFQRNTDSGAGAGVGLGLAVARGLTEAMGGTLTAEPTDGGGLTMVIRMPLAARGPHPLGDRH